MAMSHEGITHKLNKLGLFPFSCQHEIAAARSAKLTSKSLPDVFYYLGHYDRDFTCVSLFFKQDK